MTHELTSDALEVVDRLQQALDDLLGGPDLDPDRARSVLAEMGTALEELRVADEELTVQAEALAASAEAIDVERTRYAELFDLAPDAYVETDEAGKVVEANRAAEELLGVPVRQLVGKLLVSFVADGDRRAFRALLRRPDDATGEVPLTMRSRTGDRCPTGLALSSHRRRDGHGHQLRWIFRDLSERTRLQAQVAGLAGDLELLESLQHLLRFAEGDEPVQRSIEDLLDVAAGLVPTAHVGTTLALPDLAGRRLARTDRAISIDEVQAKLDLGPCIEALQTRSTVRGAPSRWPTLAASVPIDDLAELIGIPILGHGPEPIGVINVYATEPVDENSLRHLERLARQAAGVLRAAAVLGASTELVGHLDLALQRQGTIEQAKGVLMARSGLGAEAAFEQLRTTARRQRRKVEAVAAEILAEAAQPSVDS